MPGWPCYSEEEIKAVSDVLRSGNVNYWTGEQCKRFEFEFAEYVGVEYAVAVANGTVALDLALKALDIGEGDEVIVTPRTFIASVSSIINAGATPVFADVDLDSQNITAKTIAAVLSEKTRAVVCVHLAGWPCDLEPIMNLAEENNFYVIEDCAQAHGAKIDGNSVGSVGHVGCWSFCQDKIISTGGEGGMVTTGSQDLWRKIWSYKDHGKSFEAVHNKNHGAGYRWLHESFGTNWRLTEMQAAIGRLQLGWLPDWQKLRWRNASRIWNTARKIDVLRAPSVPENIVHAAYKCYVFVMDGKREVYQEKINDLGVQCFTGSCPEIYREKAFEDTGYKPRLGLPNAKELGEQSLMFDCHQNLEEIDLERICSAIEKVIS